MTSTSSDQIDRGLDLEIFDSSEYERRTGRFDASALPHRHLDEALEWVDVECETDTDGSPRVDETRRKISLIGERWNTLTITATIELPRWAFEYVDPRQGEDTGETEPWHGRLGIAYWCRKTILRDSSETTSIDTAGTYGFELEIERKNVHRVTNLQPALVRPDSGGGDDAYATQAGHRIAEGPRWTIETDLKRSTTNLLQPEECSFDDDDDLPGNDHLVYVDLDRDPPVLYLNSDHERILAALDSDSNQGWDASVREVAYDTIEAEFWPQLLLEAAASISAEGELESTWKQGVVEKFREPIYGPGTSYEEAVDYLREDVGSPERLGRLLHDLDDAIQSHNDAPAHLNKLLRLVDNR